MWRGVVVWSGVTVAVAGASLLAGCATRRPPAPVRRTARPPAPSTVASHYPAQEGLASWYGPGFQGRLTSSREVYDQYDFTAAHRTLPLGTWARVTNLQNGRTVTVYVNDRGPYIDGRVIDLSFAAAYALDIVATGTAPVRIVVLGHEPPKRRASLGRG